MSNTSKGKANKGSKYWIQEMINSNKKGYLDKAIGLGQITWVSPLQSDNYAEYKFNQKYILQKLGFTKDLFDFWPVNQPQWDAIGVVGDTIILVEAKAHVKEVNSSISATSKESIDKIKQSMSEVQQKYYPNGDLQKWEKGYYQLGNRLTFLNKMNEKLGGKVKLVLLNIVNDPTHKANTREEWEEHNKQMFNQVIGQDTAPQDVIVINLEIGETVK